MKIISVIVPIYYGERYIGDIVRQIERCRTCLEKEYNIEVLFVNDAPDAPLSMDWKSNLVDIHIINSIYHTGIHGARVRGFKESTGEYVLFLDQDDKIMPKYFQSQLLRLGESDAVVCKAMNGGKAFYMDETYFLNIPDRQFMLKEWNLILSPGQVLIRRKFIPDIWIKNIMKNNGADDWLLWICMFAEDCRISLNDEILYEHMLWESNASNDIMSMMYSEHELLRIVYKEMLLCDYDFGLLLEGFFKRNNARTQELSFAKKKLYCLDKWMELKEHHVRFSDYLIQLDIKNIVIYGCGTLGEYIYNELKNDIEVEYFIDRNAKYIRKEIPVYTLEDELTKINTVIITLMGETEKIEMNLKEKGFENVIVLKEWLINNGIR